MNFNLFSRFSRYILIGFFVAAEISSAGSIFSRRGIGLLRYRDNVRSIGMGGVGIAVADSISFYFLNPAGLTRVNLSRIQSNFRYERASVDAVRSTSSGLFHDASVNGLGLAIPVSSRQVFALGVRPYSMSDFEFSQKDSDSTFVESLSGSGGVSELYLAYAANFGKLQAGVTADFYFGRLNRIWRLNYFSRDFNNSEDIVNRHFTGIGLHAGVQTQVGRWQLGAAVGLPTRLNVKTELNTIFGFNEKRQEGELKLPVWWGAGVGYAPNRHWLLSADYRTQRWNSVKAEELLGACGVNSHDLSFGGEFIPSFEALEGYFKRMSYRFGANYKLLPYEEIGGTKVSQWTMNLGFGLPFGRGYNRIDFAAEFGKRGNLTDNGAEENIVLIHVAVIGSERWFQRPRRR